MTEHEQPSYRSVMIWNIRFPFEYPFQPIEN